MSKERDELLRLLKLAIERVEEETENRDGRDFFGLGCGNCEAGTPTPHSLGCQIKEAIWKSERGRW